MIRLIRSAVVVLFAMASTVAGAQQAPASYTPDVSFSLKTSIAEGRLVFIGVGGAIDGMVNPDLAVATDQVVQITLINGDGVLHDVVAPEFAAQSEQIARKDSSTAVVFRADKAGVFAYFCSVPGHRAAGMEGKLLDERPEYLVLNGAVGALTKEHPMKAKVGETVRIYFGVGGPNVVSSFHVIGEIFDRVYPEASLTSPPLTDVQTTMVPAGGATIVEFKLDVPGTYILVDHSLSRLERGLVGLLHAEGEANPAVFATE